MLVKAMRVFVKAMRLFVKSIRAHETVAEA